MKLFISWSGEFSRKVAECLSIWIPTIIQTVDVFYSPDDIAKGENWGNRLSDELEQSNFGVVCLTPENVAAPWIHFEAGALSKAANSRVSAIMLGVTPSDIEGPLARLQNTAFNRDDFFRLLQSINRSSDKPLKQKILESAFNNSWENLMNDIKPIIEDYTSRAPTSKREVTAHDDRNSNSDAIQEILRIVRIWDNNRNAPIPGSTSTSIPEFEEHPKISHQKNFILSCPKECTDSVLLVMRKYFPWMSATDIKSAESMLKNYGMCSFTTHDDQLPIAFKKDLYKISPGAFING